MHEYNNDTMITILVVGIENKMWVQEGSTYYLVFVRCLLLRSGLLSSGEIFSFTPWQLPLTGPRQNELMTWRA